MKIFTKIAIVVVLAAAAIFFGITTFSQRQLKIDLVEAEFFRITDGVLREESMLLRNEYFTDPEHPDAARAFSAFFDSIRTEDVVASAVWVRGHRLLASNSPLPSLHGAHDDRLLADAFDGRAPVYRVFHTTPETRRYLGSNEAVDILVPVYIGSDVAAIIEVYIPTTKIEETLVKIIKNISIFTGLGILLAVLSIYWIANSLIARKLELLVSEIKRIAEGDLDAPITVTSSDELGLLAANFELMRKKLHSYIDAYRNLNVSLEREANERTQELSEEHSRFMAAINSLESGFIALDRDERIVAENGATRKLLDLGDDERDLNALVRRFARTFDLRERFDGCIHRGIPSEIRDVEYKDRILRVFLAPISRFHVTTKIIGMVVLIEDVTNERALQRSRDEFFSIASHELRTPLTAIRGNTSMLQDFYGEKFTDPEAKEMLADILSASERLIRIVNDFLSVSRLEQKKMEFKKEAFDIVQMIAKSVDELRDVAEKKGLHLAHIPSPEDIPSVFADPDRTKQTIVNLLGNAINYTKTGSVRITATRSDGMVKVIVTDTGIGIPREQQHLLFRKFQQAGSKILTREATQGTGLGLYICKMMVEAMGGIIRLESSEPGKGSVFSFELPVAKGDGMGVQ